MEPTDQELLAATAAGDGEAFAIFWRRHASTVMAFGIHHCATSEDVADLVAGSEEGNGPARYWSLATPDPIDNAGREAGMA
jgi:hypothetical protein